ncbi:hypothetical protein RB595_002100 [Gaeumannomyces hyphopodioides]
MIALVNGVEPFLGGFVAQNATWRWVFWIIPLLAAPTAAVIFFSLPLKKQQDDESYWDRTRRIDYGGVILNLASVLLVLIPLSGGGVPPEYRWIAKIRRSRTDNKESRGWQRLGATARGSQPKSKAQIRDTSIGLIAGALIVQGAGTGLTLQPTLVGMYDNSESRDRAVTTGLRNFIRTVGGAFGLVISGVILSRKELFSPPPPSFPRGIIASLTFSACALGSLGLPTAQTGPVLGACMLGMHYIFIFFTACSGPSLLLTPGVGNTDWKVATGQSKEQGKGGANDKGSATSRNGEGAK